MNIQSSSTNETEAARRAFLVQVEALLPTTGIAWTSIAYRPLRPFGSVGLVVTAPQMPGEAQVVAISLYNKGAIDYAHFPGNGEPYYQLLIKNASDYFVEHCVSPDPKAIVATLKVWASLGQPLQRHPLPSLQEEHLEPLRRLAAIRATLSETTQQALNNGIARCSEECGNLLGVVREDSFLSLAQGLTPAGQEALTDDLRHLAPDLLLAHFPREADGRLLQGTTVLLASYPSHVPQSRDRQMWLVACAPKRRRDPQVVTLSLASLIGVNHASRWDQARWLWDSRREMASEEERWGVTGLDWARLGLDQRAENIVFFTERCAQAHPSLTDRVSLCLLLQDEGRFEEAFALFRIEVTEEVLKILYQQPLSIHMAHTMASWSSTVMGVLAFAAPWRFASLQPGVHHRICLLPHQRQQRKACLVLVTPNKRQPTTVPLLMLEQTASNKLLPSVAWRRPREMDLKRFHMFSS